MNSYPECCDTKAMSPAYDSGPAAAMAAGLPCDELCRSMYRARTLRNAHLNMLVKRRLVRRNRLRIGEASATYLSLGHDRLVEPLVDLHPVDLQDLHAGLDA